MKKTYYLALLFVFIFGVACASDSTFLPTAIPSSSVVAKLPDDSQPVIPDDAEVDRKTAMLLGLDIHRQLWATRPTDNYKFGFKWNVGDFAYEKPNVEVRVLKNEVDAVVWA